MGGGGRRDAIPRRQDSRAGEGVDKKRVLIVEDEPSVADALRLVMEDAGFEVALAPNGREAVEQSAAAAFDLTITDVQLPDTSGLCLLSRLRRERPAHPVIVITAQRTPEVVAAALAGGACEVLLKPFPPSAILDLARRILACAELDG